MTGFVPGGVASSGLFQFTTGCYNNPLSSSFLFTAATNGLGVTTGGTSLAQTYPGWSILGQQYQAYRIHSRALKVRCAPSLAGDGVQVSTYSSTNPTPLVAVTASNAMGQARAKGGVAMFGSPVPTLYVKDKVHTIVGLTKA